jgi:intraflagellar transport protein 88
MIFCRCLGMVPEDAQVIYQIANLYDLLDDNAQAAEWFKILHGLVPSDPKVLARLAALNSKDNDDLQAFHNYMESYHYYPVNMEVIAWLGVWYVKNQVYQEALQFFQRAAEIEPSDVKWQLMVASCYRRMGNFGHALELYKKIHKQDHENIECLRYLVSICKDMNDPAFETYKKLLQKCERDAEAKAQNNYVPEINDNDSQGDGAPNNGRTSPSSPFGKELVVPPSPGLKTPSKNLTQTFDNTAHVIPERKQGAMLSQGKEDGDDDYWGEDDHMELMPVGPEKKQS